LYRKDHPRQRRHSVTGLCEGAKRIESPDPLVSLPAEPLSALPAHRSDLAIPDRQRPRGQQAREGVEGALHLRPSASAPGVPVRRGGLPVSSLCRGASLYRRRSRLECTPPCQGPAGRRANVTRIVTPRGKDKPMSFPRGSAYAPEWNRPSSPACGPAPAAAGT
jgi:hypothetical protein